MQFNRKTQKVNSTVEKEEQPGRRVNDPSSKSKTTITNDFKTNDSKNNKEFVLETNAHMRMSTFGIDPNFRKTIQVSREGIRSGSPIATNQRSFYDSEKHDLSISEKKSDYKEHERMSGMKVNDYRNTTIGGGNINMQGNMNSGGNMTGMTGGNSNTYMINSGYTGVTGYTAVPVYTTGTGSGPINLNSSNSGGNIAMNNSNVLQYMQPYTDYTYTQPVNFDIRQSNMYGSNPNFAQHTHYVGRRVNDGMFVEQPFGNNVQQSSMQMGQATYDPNRVMNTYDSNYPEERFRVETHKQMQMNELNLSLSNQRSPIREDEIIVEKQQTDRFDPEVKKAKMKEIRFMIDYSDREKQLLRDGLRMITDESCKEEEYDNVDAIYQNYGKQIDGLTKNDEFMLYARKNSRLFDPTKREGRLLTRNARSVKLTKWEDNLQNRDKVITKFKKLSSVMYPKSQHPESKSRKTITHGYVDEDEEIEEIRNTLRESKSEPRKTIMASSNNNASLRFMRITLAALSSKGHNCEDRQITRDMRFEKGGVVDLAQNKERNDKFKIRTIKGQRSPNRERHRYSNKERDKAIKIVQAWWRDLLGKYKSLLYKVLKLQSSWRSYWFRLHMFDIIYAGQMLNTFHNKINDTINNNLKKDALETLKDNFAYKYSARLYLVKLLRIQKHLKHWLGIQKNKKDRMGNVLDKIVLRRKEDTYNELKDHLDNKAKNKANNLNSLLLKTKKVTRVAIFHDMLFSIFNRPINILKGKLFRSTLRNNLTKYHLLFKREYFMRWLKKCLGKGDYNKLATDYLYKAIMKPPFRDICNKMRALPPKGLKDKLLRGILKNYDKDSQHSLKYYFLRWKDITAKLRNEEFVLGLTTRICFKTAKKLEQNKLRQKFRFWRDSMLSKRDLRPYINGVGHLEKFTKDCVAQKTLPPLRSSTKGVQARTAKQLILSNKFHLLPLRHYYNKWKDVIAKQKDMENSVNFLIAMKNKGLSKLSDRALLKRFLDWRRKIALMKLFDNKANDEKMTERKYYALVSLMNGTEKLAKRKALSVTLPKIYDWLTDLIRQRATKDLLFMFPKLNRIALRGYWNKWQKKNEKLRQQEVRAGFFANLSNKTGSKLQLKNLKKHFKRWQQNMPKNMQIKYYQGSEKMRNAITRSHLAKPVEAMKQKIMFNNAKNGIQHAFGLKDKFIKRHWRDYLIKWWKISDKLKAKEQEQRLTSKLISGFSESYVKRILSKWFNHWKKPPKINLNDVYNKFRAGADLAKKVVHRALAPARKSFFDNLKNTNSKPFMRKVIDKLMGMATSGNDKKLRHYLWFWKCQAKNAEIFDLKLKLMKSNVNNNKERMKRNELYHIFNRWKKALHTDYLLGIDKKNNDIHTGVAHLQHLKFIREFDFFSRLKRLMNADYRPMLMHSIRKRLMGPRFNTRYAFLKWKKVKDDELAAERELDVKLKLLRQIGSKTDKLSLEYLANRKHQAFLRWRILSNPSNILLNMKRLRNGTRQLTEGLQRLYNNGVVDKLKKHAHEDKVREALMKMLSKNDDKAKLEYLRIKFKWWRVRVGDTEKAKNKLRSMANKLVVSKPGHDALVAKPKNDIVDAMKTWHNLKTHKAGKIHDYCKSLLLILQKMKNMKRVKLLHSKMIKLSRDDAEKLRINLRLWKSQAQKLKIKDSADTIQNFTRDRLNKMNDKKAAFDKAGDNMTKFLKLYAFNNIWLQSQQNRRRQLLVKLLPDIPPEIKKEYLKKYFLKWWGVIKAEKELKAANAINNKARAFRSGKKRKVLENQRDKVDRLLKKLYLKFADKKDACFQLWRANVRKEKQKESAEVIQNFARPFYNKFVKDNAQDKLYRLVKKKVVKDVVDALKKASRVQPDRETKLYNTLENMFIRAPFDKLKLAAKWISIIGKMREVCPKVHAALRKHFVPPKLRLWYNHSVGAKNDEKKKHDDWLKDELDRKNREAMRKKNKFLEKHIQKLDKISEIEKSLSLKHWGKNAKLHKFNDAAAKIQAVVRGNNIRNKYVKEVNREKLRKLTKVLFLRDVVAELKDSSYFMVPLKRNLHDTNRNLENRYAVNNLVNIANNDYRNKMMEVLTGKKCFNSNLLSLRFWFNKWKTNSDKINDSAIKLQNKFRSRKAKKKAQAIRRANDILVKKVLHYSDSDENKKRICLRMWATKANLMKVEEDAAKINSFCRNALDKNRIKKMQKMFPEWAKKLAKKRVLGAVKLDTLELAIQRAVFKGVIPRLVNKDKANKLKWKFIKRFNTMDDQLKGMYLQKYLRLWRVNANKIKEKEKDSAVKLQTNFRSSKIKKKTDRDLDIMKRVNKMLLRMWTRMCMRKNTAFKKWLGIVNEMKVNDSSKKIQDFCRDGQKKLRSKNKSAKERALDKFVKTTMDNIDKAEERPVFQKLKDEANRNKLARMVKALQKKKDDHLKTAEDNIKNYGDMKYEAFKKSARKIQNAWNNNKWKRHIWNLILKIRKLKFLARMMMDRDARFKYKALKLWKRNSMIPGLLDSAKIIQDFCRNKILIPRLQKIPLMKKKCQEMFRKNLLHVHILPILKKITNAIKLDKFQLHMKKYIFRKLKYNIENREKTNLLRKLFRLPTKLSNKLLKTRLRWWRDQAEKIKNDQAAKKLQKNFRSHNKRAKEKKLKDTLEKQMKWLHLRCEDLKKYYLLWWQAQTQKIIQNESATIIQNFTRKEWDRIKTKARYIRFADGLWKRFKIDNNLALLGKYKMFRRINPLVKNWDLKLKRAGFDGLHDKGRLRRIGNLMKSMFGNFEKRDDILKLNVFFRRWRGNTAKLHQRDRNLEKMVKTIQDRDDIGKAKTIGDACIAKRLGKLLDTIRAKDAFKNLKWRAKNKKSLEDLGENLVKGKDDVEKKNNQIIKDKLFKLYIYKVFSNMGKALDKTVQQKFKPVAAKQFINQLQANQLAKSKEQYNSNKQNLRSGKPKKLNFNGKSVDAKKDNDQSGYDVDQLAVPAGTKILTDLKDNKLKDAFNKIRNHARNKDFAKKFSTFVRKTARLPESFDKLKDGLKYEASRHPNQDKLRKMFRMHFIKKLKEDLNEPAKMMKQRYLIRLAFMHKNANDKRTYREIVRKWRFHVMMMKFMKKKSENIYKQMHLNYLNIVNGLMGEAEADGFGNGSLFNEVSLLNKNMGLYKLVDPNKINDHNDLEETKLEKSKKFYKFFGLDYKPKRKDNEEENEHVDDDNPDIYSNDNMGGNTFRGRYGEDTIKSITSKKK